MKSETTEIKIQGMVCRACTDAVEEALLHLRGVIKASVSYFKGSALVEYDPELVSVEEIKRRIEARGYGAGDRDKSGPVVDLICLGLVVILVWFLMISRLNPVPELTADVDLGYIFLIGLLTGTHCVGMCGGILLSQTAGRELGTPKSAQLKASLAYNAGRVISYTAIGALFGALGTVISYGTNVKSMVFTMTGLAVSIIGLNMWGLITGLRALTPMQGGFCVLPSGSRRKFAGRPLIIGLLTGLMPCGSLYAMWLCAMERGNALDAALVMMAFSLGTVPVMAVFGALGAFIPRKWTKYMLNAGAVLVTAMGIKMLISGLLLVL